MQKRLTIPPAIILACLLFFNIIPLIGQDDFWSDYRSMPDDTLKVRFLHTYLKETRGLPPDTMFAIASEGLKLAEILNDQKGKAFMFMYQGLSKAYQGEFSEAIPFLTDGVNTHLKRNDTLEAGKTLINLGLAYDYMGDTDQALVQYKRAADFLNQVNQPNSRLFHNIAIIYRKQEKYARAKEYYLHSLSLKKEENDSLGIAKTWFNLATLHQHLQEWDSAQTYVEQSLDFFKKNGLNSDIAAAQTVMGNIFLAQDQLEEAKTYLNKSWLFFEKHPDDEFYLHTTADLARLFVKEGKWREAESFAKRAFTASEKQQRKPETIHTAVLLSEILEAQNKDDEAIHYLRQAYQMKDALTEEKRLSLMEEMQARFEVGQAEYEQKLQTLSFQQEQKINQIILAILGLIIMGILFFLYQKNRNNRLLKSKNARISQALSEKNALMKEMHHRVKNNLQFISSLLRLQTRHLSDAQAQEVLLSSRTRVLSMALIHEHLYQDQGITTIEMEQYIGKLTKDLMASLQSPQTIIQLETEIDSIIMDVDQAVPIGLIVNELICNSVKHAFPDRSSGQLHLSLLQKEDLIKLAVADNGIGFQEEKLKNGQSSFGLKLVNLLAEKLNANIEWQQKDGTQVILTFAKSSYHS